MCTAASMNGRAARACEFTNYQAPSQRLNSALAFTPPKPKPLDRA
jgi:hypothetical protein